MFEIIKNAIKNLDCMASLAPIPWDSELFGVNIYSLSDIQYPQDNNLRGLLRSVDVEARSLNVELMITRVNQSELVLVNALEEYGFRYIETNYKPFLCLEGITYPLNKDWFIVEATPNDVVTLSRQIKDMFKYGRYHQDLRISNDLADRRYQNWLLNAEKNAAQRVYICSDMKNAQPIAFFVVEEQDGKEVFLSLVGMMEHYRGRGLSKDVWKTFIMFLKQIGITKISTSISSHNLAIFNLYTSMGFVFPEPELTLHKWLDF